MNPDKRRAVLRGALHLFWVLGLAFFFANTEIEIEGANGWASSLPTWRVEKHALLSVFWGGRPLTGYHAWVFSFMALVFHTPMILAGKFSLKLWARSLGGLMLFWIAEDFLWFAQNPHFGLQKLNPGTVPWHISWTLGWPTDYLTFSLMGAGLIFYSLRPSRPSAAGTGLRKILCAAIVVAIAESSLALKPDETVVFYPSQAHFDARENCWRGEIRGWVFEPEEDSVKRKAVLELAENLFGRELNGGEEAVFHSRAIRFLADSEGGKKLSITIGGERVDLGESDGDGILSAPFCLDSPNQSGWLGYETLQESGDQRVFRGKIQLVPAEGWSVVSDIDDTIKVSNVRDRTKLMENTFLKDLAPVKGMAELYARWEAEGAVFHYLSGSPWQLYEPLFAFLRREGFPEGGFYLRAFSLTPAGLSAIAEKQEKHKKEVLEGLLSRYPKRKFLLVGDSGELDPEIYGETARNHPGREILIFIRDVTGEPETSPRYLKAFKNLPPESFAVFKNPPAPENFTLRRKR